MLELEEFRNNILQENQLLKENITSLHLQIKELERFSSAHTSAEIAKVFLPAPSLQAPRNVTDSSFIC